QAVIAIIRLQPRHPALVIVDVPEDNGLSRTSLRTGSNNLAISNLPIFFLRLDLCSLNSLHAISALLHNPAASDRDVGVAQHLETRSVEVLIEKKVEPANFVRTVVGAIPRAYAAVVSHVVQAFSAVNRGCDRTHKFARRVFALLARYRLKICLRILLAALVISVDSKPVHFATSRNLFFPDHRNVVFSYAGYNAS